MLQAQDFSRSPEMIEWLPDFTCIKKRYFVRYCMNCLRVSKLSQLNLEVHAISPGYLPEQPWLKKIP